MSAIKVQGILISFFSTVSMIGLSNIEMYKSVSNNWLVIILLVFSLTIIFGYGIVKLFDVLGYNDKKEKKPNFSPRPIGGKIK